MCKSLEEIQPVWLSHCQSTQLVEESWDLRSACFMPVGIIHQNIRRKLVVMGDNGSVSSWTWLNCTILTDAFIWLDRLHLMFLYHLRFCSTAVLSVLRVLCATLSPLKPLSFDLHCFSLHVAVPERLEMERVAFHVTQFIQSVTFQGPTCASHFREHYWHFYLHAVWAELLPVSTGKIMDVNGSQEIFIYSLEKLCN